MTSYLVVLKDSPLNDYFITYNLTLVMCEFYTDELKEYGFEKVKELFFRDHLVFKGINGIDEMDKNSDI